VRGERVRGERVYVCLDLRVCVQVREGDADSY
jgi:hypothetical protein